MISTRFPLPRTSPRTPVGAARRRPGRRAGARPRPAGQAQTALWPVVLLVLLWACPRPGHLVGHGGTRRPDEWLAALARRSSAVLPQRPGHPRFPAAVGNDRRLRSVLHGGISQERGLSRLLDPSRTGRLGLRRRSSGTGLQGLCPDLGRIASLAGGPGGVRLAVSGPGRRHRGPAVPALRLDGFPDQLRRVRHAPLSAGHPPGLAGHGRLRRVPEPGGIPPMVGRRPSS